MLSRNLHVIIDNKDDFPAPEGPIIDKKDPLETSPLRFFRIYESASVFLRDRFFHSSFNDVFYILQNINQKIIFQ